MPEAIGDSGKAGMETFIDQERERIRRHVSEDKPCG